MTVSAIGGAPAAIPPQAVSARAADGDYLKPTAASSQARDNDGDYRPLAAASSPAASSSSSVQSALTLLKTGG